MPTPLRGRGSTERPGQLPRAFGISDATRATRAARGWPSRGRGVT